MADAAPAPLDGDALPALRTPVPGPNSRALAARLARVESRNITHPSPHGPVFWAAARGAAVRDVDGNRFIDLTCGFGVAFAGHADPRVAEAVARQAGWLPHALGDVHPGEPKVRLLERLADLAPGDLAVSILASAGAEAVEAALKTARLATGRPGVLAFEGAYHGLTYGALAATWRDDFRAPFRDQLFTGVRFAPFPADAPGEAGRRAAAAALAAVRAELDAAERGAWPVGAILVEPVQGRGGLRVPPPAFLAALRDLCDGERRVLIMDEIFTGLGRTGRWFACQHEDVVPDLMTVGKALGGGVPLSAAIGTPAVMNAWPPSTGEALHTSTFLGNPVACAAALAQLDAIEADRLVERAAALGERIRARTERWAERIPGVVAATGRGLLQGVRLAPAAGLTAGQRATAAAAAALRSGVLVLAEGSALDTLAITPPAVISEAQLDHALDVLEAALTG
jgi:4-aminobutyrate aminotransferase-like enzyme